MTKKMIWFIVCVVIGIITVSVFNNVYLMSLHEPEWFYTLDGMIFNLKWSGTEAVIMTALIIIAKNILFKKKRPTETASKSS